LVGFLPGIIRRERTEGQVRWKLIFLLDLVGGFKLIGLEGLGLIGPFQLGIGVVKRKAGIGLLIWPD